MEREPAIRRLTIRNFLSFGEQATTVDLQNLNVLIGANGSGKSNLPRVHQSRTPFRNYRRDRPKGGTHAGHTALARFQRRKLVRSSLSSVNEKILTTISKSLKLEAFSRQCGCIEVGTSEPTQSSESHVTPVNRVNTWRRRIEPWSRSRSTPWPPGCERSNQRVYGRCMRTPKTSGRQ
jgi:hypothetical protein